MFFLCYYFRDTPSFKSILEKGIDEAKLFLKENDTDWRSRGDYIHHRIEVEQWLRKRFIIKGGKPVLQHPIYMSLGLEKVLEADIAYKYKFIIPLEIFTKDQISFTYVDSMHTQEGKRPLLFLMNEIKEMIDSYGTGYTEAQIWDVTPLDEIIKTYELTGRLVYY